MLRELDVFGNGPGRKDVVNGNKAAVGDEKALLVAVPSDGTANTGLVINGATGLLEAFCLLDLAEI